jgi:predicted nucleic-acid-binding protein
LAISGLLDAADVRFEVEPAIEEALFIWEDTTADFADCLIGARNRKLGCRATATFDVKAARQPGCRDLSRPDDNPIIVTAP